MGSLWEGVPLSQVPRKIPSYVTTFSRSKVCLKPAKAMADILGSFEDDTTPCDGCAEKDGRLLPPFLVVRDVGKGMSS